MAGRAGCREVVLGPAVLPSLPLALEHFLLLVYISSPFLFPPPPLPPSPPLSLPPLALSSIITQGFVHIRHNALPLSYIPILFFKNFILQLFIYLFGGAL